MQIYRIIYKNKRISSLKINKILKINQIKNKQNLEKLRENFKIIKV